jgi:hypothetical protein
VGQRDVVAIVVDLDVGGGYLEHDAFAAG